MVQVASSRELVALRPPGTKDTSDASCAHITRSVCPCHMIKFTRSCSGWTHRMRGLPTSSRPAKAETLLQDIDETFRNLRAKRVKLNLEKCVFGRGTPAWLPGVTPRDQGEPGENQGHRSTPPRAHTSMPLSSNKSPARTTWLPMSSPGSPPQGNPLKAARSWRSFTNPPARPVPRGVQPVHPHRALKMWGAQN